MRSILFAIAVPLLLAGCLSYHETTPQRSSTIVVPPGSVVTCSSGMAPPC